MLLLIVKLKKKEKLKVQMSHRTLAGTQALKNDHKKKQKTRKMKKEGCNSKKRGVMDQIIGGEEI